jgi:hypothetical protein
MSQIQQEFYMSDINRSATFKLGNRVVKRLGYGDICERTSPLPR